MAPNTSSQVRRLLMIQIFSVEQKLCSSRHYRSINITCSGVNIHSSPPVLLFHHRLIAAIYSLLFPPCSQCLSSTFHCHRGGRDTLCWRGSTRANSSAFFWERLSNFSRNHSFFAAWRAGGRSSAGRGRRCCANVIILCVVRCP